MQTHRWTPAILTFGVAVAGSILYSSFATPVRSWVDVLPSLYYIPIVIAAIIVGKRAALMVALASGAALAASWMLGGKETWIHPFSEALLFVFVGLTAAKLAEGRNALAAQGEAWTLSAREMGLGARDAENVRQSASFGQIVTGLIRRFRTPVSSIEGAVWLLGDERLPDEKRDEFVQIIRRESHQMERALSDIEEYTRPRSPMLRKADLSQLMDEVIELAGPREHGPFFLFRKDLPPKLGRLTCDPEQIRHLLLNLVMNAIQAMPQGGQIILSVRLEENRVIISVIDHGRGISSEVADRMFGPFFTTRERGLGLGLTVAQQIAVAHSGEVRIEGSSGTATCVSVVLPLLNPHDYGADSRS
jgi:signal transduction histidine kinase